MSLAQAAAAQGVGPDAIRKRIPTGQVRARKRAGRWQVWMSAADLDIRIVPDQPDNPEPPVPDNPDAPDIPDVPEHQEAPASPTLALQAARAQEMAQYTAALLEPLHARLERQAEEIGKLKAELAQERLSRRREHEDAPPAESQAGRSWWARLWG